MKLLFITSTRIGDAIISTTVLNHMLAQYPSARVTVACGALPAALFEDLPNLDKLITVTKKKMAQHWLKLWRQTVTSPWDMAIDLRGSALTYCLMSRQRMIWRSNSELKTRHEQLLDLLDTQQRVLPQIWISPERQKKLQNVIPSNVPVIAIAPAANWLGKEWPQENYIKLLQTITSPKGQFPGAKIAIFAAPHEYERLGSLKQTLQDQLIDVSAYPHLLDVAALLKQCTIFIGNDSGLMHLAAAVGTPTLGLFGPSDDRLYRPTGAVCDFVRTPETFEHLWSQVKAGNEQGLMDSLTVDMVLAKLGAFKDRKPHRMTGQKSLEQR
jgi:ADP-heptose:LPS heptosyltransferase